MYIAVSTVVTDINKAPHLLSSISYCLTNGVQFMHSGDRFFYGFLITVGRDAYLAARACITMSPTPLSTAVGR